MIHAPFRGRAKTSLPNRALMIDTIKQSAAAVATSREVHRVPALTICTVLFFLDRRCCSGTVLIMVLHGARLPMEAGAPYRATAQAVFDTQTPHLQGNRWALGSIAFPVALRSCNSTPHRSFSAVATSREGHRKRRSGRTVRHPRWHWERRAA